MKATKIMGVVLGALLIAALFVGAGAAAMNQAIPLNPDAGNDAKDIYLGTAYAYGVYTSKIDLATNSTWVNAAGQKVTFLPAEKDDDIDGGFYINGADVEAEGDYFIFLGGNKYHIDVKMPTAAISGSVYKDEAGKELLGSLIGSTAANDKFIKFNELKSPALIALTNPGENPLTSYVKGEFGFIETSENSGIYSIKGADLGKWAACALFEKGNKYDALGGVYITKYAPKYIYGEPYYFTIVSSDDAKKIESDSEEIVQGGYATITVTAPTGTWNVSVENGFIPSGQPFVSTYSDDEPVEGKDAVQYWKINVPAKGEVSFSVKATSTSDIKVKLLKQDNEYKKGVVSKSVTIKVKSGSITAVAEKAAVYIGNDIDLDGTNDLGGNVFFYIKGTNFPLAPIMDDGDSTKPLVASGKIWDATITTSGLAKKVGGKKVDAGTYTIYVVSINKNGGKDYDYFTKVEDFDNSTLVNAYATASVALKQPFIQITDAPDVAVQGEAIKVKGTAEGNPDEVYYYIFGTNYFIWNKAAVTDGEFTVEVKKDLTEKEKMAAGQYFLVIQHPMYDKQFNVWAEDATNGYNIYAAATTDGQRDEQNKALVFNTADRQSANGAKALCDELDKQYIDDMYVKASFVVAGPTSEVNAIPSQVTKGQVLTVSGKTTGHKDDVVTVELLSTAFAAMPKEAVGSASFVALTTKIGDDGVWSISFDTSNLNADAYTCSVAVGQLDAVTAKVTIVEGSTPVTPTQTTTPVTPTAQPTAQPSQTPATPGFGALAALAGLGAVAVLLLRRE